MIKEFKDFISRGNIVEIAVAFVLGVAFAAVVASFVDDILMQIVAAIFQEPDFSTLTFDLGDAVVRYGAFINAVISFLIIAFAVFLAVKAYNKMVPPPEPGPTEVEVLEQIRDQLASRT